MPTVVLFDNSLSMYKNLNENLNKKDLCKLIINNLFDKLNEIDKYEYVSLISYSMSHQVVCEFTREYKEIINSFDKLEPGDCFCLEEAFNKVHDLVIEDWGCFTDIKIIVLTDNTDNLNQQNSVKCFYKKLINNKLVLKDLYLSVGLDFDEDTYFKNSILNEELFSLNQNYDFNIDNNKKNYFNLRYPFSFPNKLYIICLNEDYNNKTNLIKYCFDDENFKFQIKKINDFNDSKISYLNDIIKLNSSIGNLYELKNWNKDFVVNEFLPKFINEIFTPYDFELKCGNLSSYINLLPNPINNSSLYYSYANKELNKSIDIIGFINIPDLVTPQTLSRHLIISNDKSEETGLTSKNSFLFLLHTSLKSENMAAVVKLSNDWYGAIHCGSNNKQNDVKKGYLMLAIFKPESDTIENIASKAIQSATTKTPVSPNSLTQISRQIPIKSYAKGCIVWYRAYNLISDVQKILRNGKKMQEKMPMFYKELNRVRRAALTFGFYELFQGLSKMLERELINYGNSYNQEATVQLTHAIKCLNSNEYKEYRKDIQPWISQTSFTKNPRK